MSIDATPVRLIRAARAVFARSGYDGASVRSITSSAGANLGAITYHFGSKRELYGAVLASVMAPLAERVQRVAAESEDPALPRIEAVVRGIFAHLERNPDMPLLLVQEISAGRRPPEAVVGIMTAAIGALASLVAEGQREGTIRAGDPRMLALSCIAQPVYLTLVHPVASEILGLDYRSGPPREGLVRHALAFVRAGLTAEAADDPPVSVEES